MGSVAGGSQGEQPELLLLRTLGPSATKGTFSVEALLIVHCPCPNLTSFLTLFLLVFFFSFFSIFLAVHSVGAAAHFQTLYHNVTVSPRAPQLLSIFLWTFSRFSDKHHRKKLPYKRDRGAESLGSRAFPTPPLSLGQSIWKVPWLIQVQSEGWGLSGSRQQQRTLGPNCLHQLHTVHRTSASAQ